MFIKKNISYRFHGIFLLLVKSGKLLIATAAISRSTCPIGLIYRPNANCAPSDISHQTSLNPKN